jgi:hypothetical protein
LKLNYKSSKVIVSGILFIDNCHSERGGFFMAERRFPIQDIENRGANKRFDGFPMVQIVAYDSVNDCLRGITLDGLAHFATNDIDKASSTVLYEGLTDSSGTWQIVKTETTGDVTSLRFATTVNNPATTDYATAWTNRATLEYDYYFEAFSAENT